MSLPFLSEIRIFGFDFPPVGWAQCNGAMLLIEQNQHLFDLIGTSFGGDGVKTFGIPDLRGRIPLHQDYKYIVGQQGGEATHRLIGVEMAPHIHQVQARSSIANQTSAAGNTWAASDARPFVNASNTTLHPGSISSVGMGKPHENMSPYLVVNFCIALDGIYPAKN